MRNLSMKKFGTPIGAAPGLASERGGVSSVGGPAPWRPGEGTCLARRRALRTFSRTVSRTVPTEVSVFARTFFLTLTVTSPPSLAGLVVWPPPCAPPPVLPPPPPVTGLPPLDPGTLGTLGTLGTVGVGTRSL